MEFKVPTSREEMEALRKSLVQEIDDNDLDDVAGGNQNVKGKEKEGIPFRCPYCQKVLTLFSAQDGPKHMVQECPNNPYK